MKRTISVGIALLSLSLVMGNQSSIAAPSATKYVSFLAGETGGYTTYEWSFQRTPSVVVYSDGQTISEIPVRTLVYPGPIVSSYLQKTERGAVSRITTAASKANLSNPKFDWGTPWITDVPDTTVITQLSSRASKVTVSIYALGWDGTGLTPAQVAARKSANGLIDSVENFNSKFFWTKSKPIPWKPTKWVYMSSIRDADEYSIVRPWFGSKTLKADFQCVTMSQQENYRLNALLPKLNQSSRWTSEGETWMITLRPLFPHETGCKDLSK